ncbi:MAG: hypothetical protein DLM54_01810 [Acidimicrobiales bacterium]|nr:MAG: hypothetical protein DLM54_01810 [Acidimicrobiales bacterium]
MGNLQDSPPATDPRPVFGGVAETYDRIRPAYPKQAVDDVIDFAQAQPGDRMLEVGAGTGKATALFAGRSLGVVALEATPEMAEVARRNCAGSDVLVRTCAFEDWQEEEEAESFRLVVSAQSWHWMPADRCALAHRALVPGGSLAVLWNTTTWPDPDLRLRLEAIYRRHAPTLTLGGPSTDHWLAEMTDSGPFGSPRRLDYRFEVVYPIDQYLELIGTYSDHLVLGPQDLGGLLEAVAEALDPESDVRVEYQTKLLLARRAG